MPRRKKTEPQSAPRALWPGSLKQPCLYRHGCLLSGSNGRAKRAPHVPRFAHRAAPCGAPCAFCGRCGKGLACAAFVGKMRAARAESGPFRRTAARKHRPRKTVFAPSLLGFPQQPQRAPAESFPALHQKLPLSGIRAVLAGQLWRNGVRKSPSGPPGFLHASGTESISPSRCFLASTRLSRGLFIFLLCPQTRPVRGP